MDIAEQSECWWNMARKEILALGFLIENFDRDVEKNLIILTCKLLGEGSNLFFRCTWIGDENNATGKPVAYATIHRDYERVWATVFALDVSTGEEKYKRYFLSSLDKLVVFLKSIRNNNPLPGNKRMEIAEALLRTLDLVPNEWNGQGERQAALMRVVRDLVNVMRRRIRQP